MLRILLAVIVLSVLTITLWSVLDRKANKINVKPSLVGSTTGFLEAPSGTPQLDMELQTSQNKVLRLSQFRGQVVLLNLWATWCIPCIRELPSILKLSDKFSSRQFTVIALSQDMAGWRKIRPFLRKHNLEKLMVFADTRMQASRLLQASAYLLPYLLIKGVLKLVG